MRICKIILVSRLKTAYPRDVSALHDLDHSVEEAAIYLFAVRDDVHALVPFLAELLEYVQNALDSKRIDSAVDKLVEYEHVARHVVPGLHEVAESEARSYHDPGSFACREVAVFALARLSLELVVHVFVEDDRIPRSKLQKIVLDSRVEQSDEVRDDELAESVLRHDAFRELQVPVPVVQVVEDLLLLRGLLGVVFKQAGVRISLSRNAGFLRSYALHAAFRSSDLVCGLSGG